MTSGGGDRHPWRVRLAEKLDGLAGNADRAPEVCRQQGVCIGIFDALCFSQTRVPGVVEHDIDVAECTLGQSKGLEDVLSLGDVRLGDEDVVGGVLLHEVVEHVRTTGCRDD